MSTMTSEQGIATQKDISEIKIKCGEHATKNALMAKDIADIKEDVKEIKLLLKDFGNIYVSKEEFTPVKSIVYGMIGFILLAFLGALTALVLNR